MIPLKNLSFTKSEYFYINENGWNLKEDAPEKIKKEFEKFKKEFKAIKTGDINNK